MFTAIVHMPNGKKLISFNDYETEEEAYKATEKCLSNLFNDPRLGWEIQELDGPPTQ